MDRPEATRGRVLRRPTPPKRCSLALLEKGWMNGVAVVPE
jgi:hypothetical protein